MCSSWLFISIFMQITLHKPYPQMNSNHFLPHPHLSSSRDGDTRKNSTIWTCGKLRKNWKGQKTPGKIPERRDRERERVWQSAVVCLDKETLKPRGPSLTGSNEHMRSCQTSWLLPRGPRWYPQSHCFSKIHSFIGFYLCTYLFFISGVCINSITFAHTCSWWLVFYLESINIHWKDSL